MPPTASSTPATPVPVPATAGTASAPPAYRPRDCYTLAEIIARYVPHADVTSHAGRHRARRCILFARQHKGLPHIYFGTRTIMYPRQLVDAWLLSNQRHCQSKPPAATANTTPNRTGFAMRS